MHGVNRNLATDIANELCVPAYVKEDQSTCVVMMNRELKELMRIHTKSEFEAIEVTNYMREMIVDAIEKYEQVCST